MQFFTEKNLKCYKKYERLITTKIQQKDGWRCHHRIFQVILRANSKDSASYYPHSFPTWVMGHPDQKQFGKENSYFSSQIKVLHEVNSVNELRVGSWRQELKQRPQRVLLSGLVPMAYSA